MRPLGVRPRPARLDARREMVLEFDLDLLDRGRKVSLLLARLWRRARPRWERLSK